MTADLDNFSRVMEKKKFKLQKMKFSINFFKNARNRAAVRILTHFFLFFFFQPSKNIKKLFDVFQGKLKANICKK